MTPTELAALCAEAMNHQECGARRATILLVLPPGWRPLPRFPRGRLLLVKQDGSRVVRINAMNVLAWMVANDACEIVRAQPADN